MKNSNKQHFDKPSDYTEFQNINLKSELKQMDKYVIKLWWKKSTNGKDSYVIKGQQLYDTYLARGIKHDSVLKAMIAKFNENIINCKKIEIYNNSAYSQIMKVITFNGVETFIHQKLRDEFHYCIINNYVSIGLPNHPK